MINETCFYKYLRCPSWVVYEAENESVLPDSFLHLVQSENQLDECVLALLGKRKLEAVAPVGADYSVEEAAQATLRLMATGVKTIRRPILQSGRYVARPALLERVEGRSSLGDYYYVACDFKRSSRLKEEYQYEASFYAEVLNFIQGVRPHQGYVIHPDASLSKFSLDEFYPTFHILLEKIEEVLAEKKIDNFLTSACKQSPYFDRCVAAAEKLDDLSLLNRLWRSEAEALRTAGLNTITKLADSTPQSLQKVPGLTLDRLYFLQQQARALADKQVVAVGQVDLAVEDEALVIDVESDPLRDVHYLFGVLHVKGDKRTTYYFVAESPEDERGAWLRFCDFLQGFKRIPMYHYGWYEVDVFNKLRSKYGAPPEVIDLFTQHNVDLNAVLRERLLFPSPFYSLKDIAKFLGFKWHTAEASGLESIRWYEEWLATGDRAWLEKIIEYNTDDIEATWFVKDWAAKNHGK